MGVPTTASPGSTMKSGKKYKPVFLHFTDVTQADMSRIIAAESKAQVKTLLKDLMKVDQADGFRMEIIADMHYHNYSFCTSQNFSAEKTSTFLSLMKLVLQEAISKRHTVDDAFEVFKQWLLKHSVERPPWSVGVFTFDDIKAIMDYAHNTFFRHYRLYTHVFMTHCDMIFHVDELRGCIAPPPIRPLPMRVEDEVDPRAQPELAGMFRPDEQAEAAQRARAGEAPVEDKAALIKRKVDAGVAKLMEKFEQMLQAQDDKFSKDLAAREGN
mmetsp:Transcript_33296/g.69651  ORF Transcript_33296/g.69651 Transcript_33296/m.69651 type:complete len:270 (-) Transcript_33296:51-860(-)